MRRWIVLLAILTTISACSALAGDSDANTAQTTDNTSESETTLVNWDKDPLHIVFQADVIGGEVHDTFVEANRIPLCTIYGDGRLVWLSEDDNQVLFDLLTDDEITEFVTYLTVDERFYTFTTGLDTQLPVAEVPITDVILLQVNDISHKSDSFGSWTQDYFNRILDNCISLADQPRIFQPSEGWLSISAVSYDSSAINLPWDADAAGLSLLDVAEMPASSIWLENSLVVPIWTTIRENGIRVQFAQDDLDFQIALRVPGVTFNAPPPPTDENPDIATEEPSADG